MVFVGIHRALYDYMPTGENELELKEDDLLFVLDKNTGDNWWKAKKKAAEDDDEEPEGLIPNNYVEEAKPIGQAKALYDYNRQTDEEISLREDDIVHIYDTSDSDWTLVGVNEEFGFAPANYIEVTATSVADSTILQPESNVSTQQSGPAAALAGLIQQRTGPATPQESHHNARETLEEEEEEEAPPSLPRRPTSQSVSPPPMPTISPRRDQAPGIMESPSVAQHDRTHDPTSPSGFHLYNIHEMVSHMGRNKKMPMTLGVNSQKGTIMIAPESARDGPQQEWTAEKLAHYSLEGKHVFMELVRPSKSIDLHAGAKDTAAEIVSALGDLAGAARAGQQGLGEVYAAGSGTPSQKKGRMLYEFMAQGDDELTVAVDDEVVILDDTQSEEWWMLRRLKNGKQGVVPSRYVEITGFTSPGSAVADTYSASSVATAPPTGRAASASTRSIVEKNRREEEALTKKAVRLGSENAPEQTKHSNRRSRSASEPKSKPNSARVRNWTDRTANFRVEAEFLGLKDGKIHLHKINGVKIAVPVSKMSIDDLEYVERETGQSLDEDKPLSDIKRRSTLRNNDAQARSSTATGATVESNPPKYDWFDFFLSCGVNPQICERYAMAFARDEMGDENMPDIDATLLRTLGVKEGDVLRIMKHLDAKYGRIRPAPEATATSGDTPGLFSGAGGTLRNNTRKGRPAPAVQNNDTISAKGLGQNNVNEGDKASTPVSTTPGIPDSTKRPDVHGFDDNAWDNRPPQNERKESPSQPTKEAAAQRPAQGHALTGPLSELSLLDTPLQPTKAIQAQSTAQPQQQHRLPQPQVVGATPEYFNQLAQPAPQNPQETAQPRSRPVAPQLTGAPNTLLPLPPSRPMSAPQRHQGSQFAPPPQLVAQNTGFQARIAPPGQSMNELNLERTQQILPLQQQMTGHGYGQVSPSQQGPVQFPALAPQTQFGQMQQPMFNQYSQQAATHQIPQFVGGHMANGPFMDPPQIAYQTTGNFGQPSTMPQQQIQQQQTGMNSFFPQSLQSQVTAVNGFNNTLSDGRTSTSQHTNTILPLQPQKTGPAPPVRFGVQSDAPKLLPQPTGRANLSKATPQNPFGF